MSSNYLSSWLLVYLNRVHTLYLKYAVYQRPCHEVQEVFAAISLTVENTLGLLQNVSLKNIGVDRILQLMPEHLFPSPSE
jgi:hypothetical protein